MKKFIQEYKITITTKEEYIDRSTEIQIILDDNPIMKGSDIDVEFMGDGK